MLVPARLPPDLHVDFEDLIGCLLQRLGDGAQHEGEGGGVQVEEAGHHFLTHATHVSTLGLRGGLQ